MTGRKERAFALRPLLMLEVFVPPEHFYRHVGRSLDFGFKRDLARDLLVKRGRLIINPTIFFKLQLIKFFEGIRSERQLGARRLVAGMKVNGRDVLARRMQRLSRRRRGRGWRHAGSQRARHV